jgi:hypothetical protein
VAGKTVENFQLDELLEGLAYGGDTSLAPVAGLAGLGYRTFPSGSILTIPRSTSWLAFSASSAAESWLPKLVLM